jgi:hypothetical protein
MADEYESLGLGRAASLVLFLDVYDFGERVVLRCLCEPAGTRRPYEMIFSKCKEVRLDCHDGNAGASGRNSPDRHLHR